MWDTFSGHYFRTTFQRRIASPELGALLISIGERAWKVYDGRSGVAGDGAGGGVDSGVASRVAGPDGSANGRLRGAGFSSASFSYTVSTTCHSFLCLTSGVHSSGGVHPYRHDYSAQPWRINYNGN